MTEFQDFIEQVFKEQYEASFAFFLAFFFNVRSWGIMLNFK